jgi:hypothetical protein
MRPNWITIAIVPAVCGALIGLGIAEVVLRYPAPLRTASSENRNNAVADKKGEVPPVSVAPAPGTAAQPTNAAESSAATDGSATSAPADKATKDVTPWWSRLIERLAWPLTLLAAMAFVAYNARLGRIFGFGTRLVKKIAAGGVEIEINSETIELVQRQLHGTFEELISGAADEYERIAEIQDVPTLLKNAIIANLPQSIEGLRGTIHVNDVIFPDYLYQLVDYYPAGGGATDVSRSAMVSSVGAGARRRRTAPGMPSPVPADRCKLS